MKLTRGSITEGAIDVIRERLLEFDEIGDVKLPGLPADRKPVIAGGLLILDAAFNELEIKRMQVSENALREGALYDIIGRGGERDPRVASILALCERYACDMDQLARVERTALALFDQAAGAWHLDADDRRSLSWAARIHEIGLAVAHSQYHQHGAYLVEHSDIAGFSRTEQQLLAVLVRNQRRGLHLPSFDALPDRLAKAGLRSALLLRLAVLLHRSHEREPLPVLGLSVGNAVMTLALPAAWLDAHPLTRADLETEQEYLDDIGFRLAVVARDPATA
jgi:exopolyphosphatase/guanosine-5'-triphosphate,3'-diphosphate pyrophosphatase